MDHLSRTCLSVLPRQRTLSSRVDSIGRFRGGGSRASISRTVPNVPMPQRRGTRLRGRLEAMRNACIFRSCSKERPCSRPRAGAVSPSQSCVELARAGRVSCHWTGTSRAPLPPEAAASSHAHRAPSLPVSGLVLPAESTHRHLGPFPGKQILGSRSRDRLRKPAEGRPGWAVSVPLPVSLGSRFCWEASLGSYCLLERR